MVQLTAVTMGVVQVLKPLLPRSEYYALVSVLVGVAVSMGYAAITGLSIAEAAFDGVVVGLISCGAYDVATTDLKGDAKKDRFDLGLHD